MSKFLLLTEGKLMGWDAVSLNNVLSNHWFRDIKVTFLGDTSVYRSDVVTLFKLSSKSAMIIESYPILPRVSLLFKISNFFSLFY